MNASSVILLSFLTAAATTVGTVYLVGHYEVLPLQAGVAVPDLSGLSEDEARSFPVNPFDLTKVWPHELAPLREIGRLELNRNVENYFAETEQAAFAPSNLVPGISASPDKMLQARLMAYQDCETILSTIAATH